MAPIHDSFNMGNETTRVLSAAAMIAGGVALSIAMPGTLAAAGAVTVAGVLGSVFSSDLMDVWKKRKHDPRYKHPNEDLTRLVGDAIERVLRDCAEHPKLPDAGARRWCGQLAKQASVLWRNLALADGLEGIAETGLPGIFAEATKSDRRELPLLAPAAWRRILDNLRDTAKLNPNTEAMNFAADQLHTGLFHEIRERAKLDFAGDELAYAALMIDMNSQILASVGRLEAAQAESNDILKKLPGWIHTLVTKMLENLGKEKRELLSALELEYRRQHDKVVALLGSIKEDTAAIREMLETYLADKKQGVPGEETPEPPPPEILEKARILIEQDDKKDKLTGYVVAQNEAEALPLLEELKREASSEIYDLFKLEGDLWYGKGEYDKAIKPYEMAWRLKPDDFTANNNLASARTFARLGNISAHCNAAIQLFSDNLTRCNVSSTHWAQTNKFLGNAWFNLPTGDRTENLRKAIRCYETALEVYTREAHKVDWAITHNNIGNAWLELPTGDRAENLGKAIKCYEAALKVFTRKAHQAMTQNNLGLAWSELPTGNRAENLGKAIKCYHAALKVYTREAHSVDWAMTQNNLGV